ncbi:sigma-70 family RNA polymerase sigma factor [Paenibacillus sp. P25]|nr:sigma-70 family RNA polymerase sigma factor [Paenibacillus sp. P25]
MTDPMETSPDEKLILLYKQGDEDAFTKLMANYTPMIHHYCRKYFAKGLDRNDLFQEGRLGLYTAMMKFQSYKGRFHSFAQIHIKSSIINAVKKATRKRQQMLSNCLSFSAELNLQGRRCLIAWLPIY